MKISQRTISKRAFDPAVTLENIRPFFGMMGLTRISNQTGLDRLGVPVVSVCRPNAKSNAVFQGKGLTLDAAKASGVMEAVEAYCAENMSHPVHMASAEQLSRNHQTVNCEELYRIAGSNLRLDSQIPWIDCEEVFSGTKILVPFELVHANFTVPYPPGSGHFLLSTTGLASGNNHAEAVLHGLCEVIERDAMTLAHCDLHAQKETRLNLTSIGNSVASDLIEQLSSKGVIVAIWNITTDISIATFKCQILDQENDSETGTLLAEGYGCHPCRAVALLRAITEAAQSRLTAIAGSRDDISATVYADAENHRGIAAWRNYLARTNGNLSFTQIPDSDLDSTEQELQFVLSQVLKSGFRQVAVVDISALPTKMCTVVRVIVPGLESPMHAHYVPGPRARKKWSLGK